jgi:SpoVK/Ycf46/Vps4 family AAA+-type ATPase
VQLPSVTQTDNPRSVGQLGDAGVLSALQRLDALLQRAMPAAQESYGSEASRDPFRGLYVTPDQAVRSLVAPPGQPLSTSDGPPIEPCWHDILAANVNWAWLRDAYGLSDFELDLVLIALAPEVDLRYERLYAYLHDDVSRKRPTVNLALSLLCATADEKLARRAHFNADAPLVTQRLLAVIPDPQSVQPPLLAYILKVDEQIVDILLRQGGLDRRLSACCRLVNPPRGVDNTWLTTATGQSLLGMMSEAWGHHPLRLYFQGPPGTGKHQAAEALTAEMGLRLLVVRLAQIPVTEHAPDGRGFRDLVSCAFREAWLQGAILELDDMDSLECQQSVDCREYVFEQLALHPGITIMAGRQPWTPGGREPLGVLVVPFALPDFAARRATWEAGLAACGYSLPADDLDALAGRFRMTPLQIQESVVTAYYSARWQAAAAPTRRELFAAARGQTGHALAGLARKIDPVYTWEDLVLPGDPLDQLHEMCQRVAFRQRVLGEWGFDRKLSLGKGISALFAGPPGTGKTMAAEVIAQELDLDLYKIDLSAVISKYIGETEKNLERIFAAATDANAILFFDEADALFGKRSEVRDSHDRYANIEIAYLLQRMEQYDGLAILATNLRQHMDEAFTRRLQFVVEFPFPDEAYRRQIWQVCFPREAPRDPALDFEHLARKFRLSGGNIKNIVLSAAYLAATENVPIGMAHLLRATRREYQKMGKVLSEADLNGSQDV